MEPLPSSSLTPTGRREGWRVEGWREAAAVDGGADETAGKDDMRGDMRNETQRKYNRIILCGRGRGQTHATLISIH